MKRFVILHASSVHSPGDNRIFHKECVSLKNRNVEVHYVGQRAGQVSSNQGVHMHSIPATSSRPARVFYGWKVILKTALRVRPNIVHLHDPELVPLGILLKLLRFKVVYDAHEDFEAQLSDKDYFPRPMEGILRWVAKLFDWITATLFDGTVFANPQITHRHRDSKTCLVRNFPDLSLWTDYVPRPSTDARVVVYVGLLHPMRGIESMIDAVGILNRSYPTKLRLIGRIDETDYLNELKQKEGWQHVETIAFATDYELPKLILGANVGIVISRKTKNYLSNYPTKLFEYMAAGLPVVASDIEGWRSIVGDHAYVTFVDPADLSAVVSALHSYLADPVSASRFGLSAQQAVAQQFSWNSEADKLYQFYVSILHGDNEWSTMR